MFSTMDFLGKERKINPMNLRERAERAASDFKAEIPNSIGDDQMSKLITIIEEALVDLLRNCAEHHGVVAKECCPSDQDLAHKIAKEINLRTVAVIANLKGQR